jgi:hypothetical protein
LPPSDGVGPHRVGAGADRLGAVGFDGEGFLVAGDDPGSPPPVGPLHWIVGWGPELGRPGRRFAFYLAAELVDAGVHGSGDLANGPAQITFGGVDR